jgi:starch synthase
MYITMVGAECAPVAKAGGLGDFIHGLARALTSRGNYLEIVLPKYDCLRFDRIEGMHKCYQGLMVPFYEQWFRCDLECGYVDGLKCLFVDPQSPQGFFTRGRIYGEPDDADRFAFFSRAVLEFLLKAGKQPDIIHCHDWQTGLVPVLRWEMYEALGLTRPRVCYTLHNMAHQGVTGEFVLHQVGLDPSRVMTADRMLDPRNPHAVNLVKGGIVYSNFVTTVSPRYAWEIQHTDLGMGLGGCLRQHDGKFGGVLNGIDYGAWNPETDTHIARNYGPDDLPGKAHNKAALRARLGLDDANRPLLSIVSRLDRQKGVDLMSHAIAFALANACQVVLLGSATDPAVDALFRDLKRRTEGNGQCHLELGYDEDLAHQIYAAADMILIPSVFEPCGLTQMIAMKYGAVPIARRVGGLADSVFDANYSDAAFEERNGYLFDDPTPQGLESALSRAISLWFEHPEYFRQLRLNGMRTDNSWAGPASRYLDIYDYVRT